jgi:DNA polymerase III delta prime subunit
LYKRDTGIDGLYLGFPFLLMQESQASRATRIAPILLWPVRLQPEVGSRGRITVSFDRDRDEVRLNPAFEGLLGIDAAGRWKSVVNELLGRATLTSRDVVEALSELAHVESTNLRSIPGKDIKVRRGEDQIVSAGALFHLAFQGQAVMEDIRLLRSVPPAGTSLEVSLRLKERPPRETIPHARELDRYLTAPSDPSQEQAVLEARSNPGLLIEGPPGTGKSQTIVNMVGDAIGRRKTLLIICQKQPALEVVHKRLVAEGLGGRIAMVTDVNKDRQPVIRAIREQAEAALLSSDASRGWRQQREQTAARIEAIEKDLDDHHAAMARADSITGLSYRQILSELIEFDEGPKAPVAVSAVRRVVANLNVSEVAAIAEACGPLARHWLPANFENSPLSDLKQFGFEPASLEDFAMDWKAFAKAERARSDLASRTPQAFQIDDPAPYQRWAQSHANRILDLDSVERERLAAWIPLLRPRTSPAPAVGLLRDLNELADELRTLVGVATDFASAAVAVSMSAADLAHWKTLTDQLRKRPTLLSYLSVSRWLNSNRLKKYMASHSLLDVEKFGIALSQEQRLRPLRVRLLAVSEELKAARTGVAEMPATSLLSLSEELAGQLSHALQTAINLGEHPKANFAFEAVQRGTREEVVAFFKRIEQGYTRLTAAKASTAALKVLEQWFEQDWVTERASAIDHDASNLDAISAIETHAESLPAFQAFRARAAHLSPQVMATLRTLRGAEKLLSKLQKADLDSEVRRIVGRESRLAWKARLESELPSLLFSADELQAKVRGLATADREMRSLNRRLLVEGIDKKALASRGKWEDVTRLTGARARRLREFLEQSVELGLMALRPVWLMNPDVASRLLPRKAGLFDAVIYDEASQMPIEYALPTLYRSKDMIVSGDEKQMPPTAFFTSRVENDEAEIFEGEVLDDNASEEEREEFAEIWNRREIKDCPDLLQLAKVVLPTTTLKVHYRSVYRELIQFSNASFYANDLSVPARHPDEEIRRIRPIELVRANGEYIAQTNEIEATKVADILASLWRGARASRKSVGVVTFNRKQADLIDIVLETRAERDLQFREALAQERDRVEDGEDMGFFVKNVENVQGDERDVIIFSSTFGPNNAGVFRRSFGVLGQTGGERRLNVAVTRAREKVVLVTSLPIPRISNFLETHRQASKPLDFLQAYFEYARAVSGGELEYARELLGRLVTDRRQYSRAQFAEPDYFSSSVSKFITDSGWTPVAVESGGAFALDFAIMDPRTGLFGIGIECDAPSHTLLSRARARDIWRPSVLGRSIPSLHRVSAKAWQEDPHREKQHLKQAIERALNGAAHQ